MLLRLLFIILFPLSVRAQVPELKEVVAKKHSNGKPSVVLYFDSAYGDLVKEHVYYANGKTAWLGFYKNNLEHGQWEFFWENGSIKSRETYVKGKEHGTSTSFDQKGKKIKESYWKNGKLIKEVNL